MKNTFYSIRRKAPARKIVKSKTPSLLYHASPFKELKVIKPRAKTVRDESEGSVVFATPDFSYSLMFLVPTDDSWALIGAVNNIYYIAIKSKRKFTSLDKGGTIYSLPVESFYCDLNKPGREKEWVSKSEVIPVNVTNVTSALYAMMEHSVQVFFVNSEVFSKLKASEENIEVLKKIKSENQKLGINPVQMFQ